jgi:hypothetical protein
MNTATVEELTTVEETTAFALRDPLGFIELGVSLGGATREKALALLKTGIDYVEANDRQISARARASVGRSTSIIAR